MKRVQTVPGLGAAALVGLALFLWPCGAQAQSAADPVPTFLTAIRLSTTATRFDRSDVVLDRCVIRHLKSDSAICARGLPHSLWQYETVVELRSLAGATVSDGPAIRDGAYQADRLIIGLAPAVQEMLLRASANYMDLFATSQNGVLRDLPWQSPAAREAGFESFLEGQVRDAAPMYTVATACDGTRWLTLPNRDAVILHHPMPPGAALSALRYALHQCR
ncbi:hypothetical protein [Pseudotabrizicola sp.]|uniref:hypothetical protein n=2 Tax=Pseudotabrizicola sp. TaxID=2939647 RepID=UPI002716D13B|nr:hypothetical protein [Pseudotabrizicola sp.]MDO8883926.1 hypothetical protein [Pseudotabrizicola sp.]MDP2082214.1 hypothetical protein [Pseudotabrizicola sp.]